MSMFMMFFESKEESGIEMMELEKRMKWEEEKAKREEEKEKRFMTFMTDVFEQVYAQVTTTNVPSNVYYISATCCTTTSAHQRRVRFG